MKKTCILILAGLITGSSIFYSERTAASMSSNRMVECYYHDTLLGSEQMHWSDAMDLDVVYTKCEEKYDIAITVLKADPNDTIRHFIHETDVITQESCLHGSGRILNEEPNF